MAVALLAWWLQKRLVGDTEVTSVTGKPGKIAGRNWVAGAARCSADAGVAAWRWCCRARRWS
jgi:hypothetical protein